MEIGDLPADKLVTKEDIKLTANSSGSKSNAVDWRIRDDVNTGTNGMLDKCFHLELKWICVRKSSWLVSNKKHNSKKKMENRNGSLRQHINTIHWNMGAKQWQRKVLEIEAVILQFTPDIFIISEANMKMCLKDEEKNITGYSMVLPLSADKHGLARVVMLIRDGVNVKIQKHYMDRVVAAIWIKIGAAGRKPMNICGVYREHKFIYDGAPDDSGSDKKSNTKVV